MTHTQTMISKRQRAQDPDSEGDQFEMGMKEMTVNASPTKPPTASPPTVSHQVADSFPDCVSHQVADTQPKLRLEAMNKNVSL